MKMPRGFLVVLSSLLWTLSFVCMSFGAFELVTDGLLLPLAWGLWWSNVALVPTGCLIVRHYAEENRAAQHDVVDLVAQVGRPRSLR